MLKQPALSTGRQTGMSLIEILVALSVFIFITLGVNTALLLGMKQREEAFNYYRAISAMRGKIAEIQEVANLDTNLALQEGVGSLHARYSNKMATVANVPGGKITTVCFPNETTVPAAFGGPQDLNFDGDASDDLTAVAFDLRLVPMSITLSFTSEGNNQFMTTHRLFTRTAN